MRRQANLGDILVFIAVADGGSFVAGGRAMGLTGSAAGKTIGRLEERLGTRLFQRTTRALSLTAEGKLFYEKSIDVLDAIEQAEASVSRSDGLPRGTLRLTVPDAFGRRVLMPIVHEYQRRWPEVRVEMNFTDRPVDLVQEGFDLAFRIGSANATNGLITRTVATYAVMLCAAPEYLLSYQAPVRPEDLTHPSYCDREDLGAPCEQQGAVGACVVRLRGSGGLAPIYRQFFYDRTRMQVEIETLAQPSVVGIGVTEHHCCYHERPL